MLSVGSSLGRGAKGNTMVDRQVTAEHISMIKDLISCQTLYSTCRKMRRSLFAGTEPWRLAVFDETFNVEALDTDLGYQPLL